MQIRDERTRVSEVCPCPSPYPRFSDMLVSESESEVKNSPGFESTQIILCPCPSLLHVRSRVRSLSDANIDFDSIC